MVELAPVRSLAPTAGHAVDHGPRRSFTGTAILLGAATLATLTLRKLTGH
jgi:hypothetical protein